MKNLTRYVSLLSAATLLSSGVSYAQSTAGGSSSPPLSDPTWPSGSAANPGASSGSTLDGSTDSSRSSSPSSTDGSFHSRSAYGIDSVTTADFSGRAQLASDIEQRIEARSDSVKSLKKSQKLEGQAKTEFKSAYDDVERSEKAVKRSLKEARNASASTWEQARTKLASDLTAYHAAVARAEAAAGSSSSELNPPGSPSTRSSRSSVPSDAEKSPAYPTSP